MDSSPDVTQLLVAWSSGDRNAVEPLIAAVYSEPKRLARGQLAGDRGHTLQPTALVHEAYMKLVDERAPDWQSRAHFFAIAAQLIRRIVLKAARRRHTAKRGGGIPHLDIDDTQIAAGEAAP
jgi:RNA polymerase sigma factor (TIGR02999 family)